MHYRNQAVDNSSRLVCVVPPEAAKGLNSANAYIAAATVNSLCYSYSYVGDRVVTKRLPGKEPERYGYDLNGRVVLFQDGNMRAAGKVMMYKYDKLNRILLNNKKADQSQYVSLPFYNPLFFA